MAPNNVSLMRWAGSKRKALPRIAEYWNENYSRYIEPFAGSASLFFFLSPQKALLSDLNPDLIRTWIAIRDRPEEVFHSLRNRPITSEYYYKLRGVDYSGNSDSQYAARFLYLNRFCFNGIYRTNLKGVFNVPYSGVGTGKKPSLKQITRCSEQLQNVDIISGDFETIVTNNVGPNDFVYLDPPYATASRRIFREYTANNFSINDLQRLAKLLSVINARRAYFVLSYAYCREALRAFSKWPSHKYFVQRNVAGFAENRRTAAEILVTNIEL